MKTLSLILSHVILFKIFQPNFFSIILLVILFAGDYIAFRSAIIYVKKRRYKELLVFKTKWFAIIFSLIAILVSCNLIYSEYLTPQAKAASDQFKECSMVKSEMQYMEPYFDIIPYSMKVPIIEMSSVTDIIREYSEKSKNCTEEEKVLLQEEMKNYVSEDMQRNTEERIKLIYIILYSELIYLT